MSRKNFTLQVSAVFSPSVKDMVNVLTTVFGIKSLAWGASKGKLSAFPSKELENGAFVYLNKMSGADLEIMLKAFLKGPSMEPSLEDLSSWLNDYSDEVPKTYKDYWSKNTLPQVFQTTMVKAMEEASWGDSVVDTPVTPQPPSNKLKIDKSTAWLRAGRERLDEAHWPGVTQRSANTIIFGLIRTTLNRHGITVKGTKTHANKTSFYLESGHNSKTIKNTLADLKLLFKDYKFEFEHFGDVLNLFQDHKR